MKESQNTLSKKVVDDLLKEIYGEICENIPSTRRLIKRAEDVLNFLFVLKSQNTTVTLDQDTLNLIIERLSKIQFGQGRDGQARKQHLSNFLHNLKYFNRISNMELFNPRAFFRSKCKVINQNQAQFVKAEIGLVNAGATCYMNATLQAFLHDPALRDSFRYGEAKTEYDNRVSNLWNYYTQNNISVKPVRQNMFWADYYNLQQWVIDERFPSLCSSLKSGNNGNADWSKAPDLVIQEIKLILKCFADANKDDDIFYKELTKRFGNNCQNLPPNAIDMSYEFFLLLNKDDSIVEEVEKGQKAQHFFFFYRFKDFMSVKNPLFKGIAANDAKDLVNFLIMTWHGEQNKAKLQQNKNPAEIASCINCLVQQINVYINNLKDNYSICKMALSNNNQWLADYWLLNVYSCKRNIQYHINEILQFAQMINNLDRDKKHQVNTSTIMQAAQSLLSAIGGYGGINDFCGDFTYMFQCANNIFNCASVVSNNQNNQMEILDQQDKQKAFNYFATNFTANNQSSISDKLYGVNYSVTTCSKCRIKSYNYQTYFFIVFPLEEVRRCKNIQGKTVTLHDCFEYDGKLNVMDGQNSMYCNYCKQNGPSTMQTSLTTTPKNLVLLFNRGKGKEFDIDINCPEFFDQHDIGKDFAIADQKYTIKQIYSTVKHEGESSMSGHFITDGDSERDGSLNRYNDGSIQVANEKGMRYLNFLRDMEPNEQINKVSQKLQKKQDEQKVSLDKNLGNYLKAIAVKFSELGELDIKKEKKNESRRLRFSYLLMQAVLPCLAKNEKTGVHDYQLLPDDNAIGLICAIFNLIENETDFNDDFMETCRSAIQCEKEAIRVNQLKKVDIKQTTENMESILKGSLLLKNGDINNINNNIINSNKNNINQSGQYNPYASESPKYKPASKKILTWLKFIFATICAVGAIVAVIFESYILTAILLAATLLTLFGKLIFSSCLGCCHQQDYNYDTTLNGGQNYDKTSTDYNQSYPGSENYYNQYENDQH